MPPAFCFCLRFASVTGLRFVFRRPAMSPLLSLSVSSLRHCFWFCVLPLLPVVGRPAPLPATLSLSPVPPRSAPLLPAPPPSCPFLVIRRHLPWPLASQSVRVLLLIACASPHCYVAPGPRYVVSCPASLQGLHLSFFRFPCWLRRRLPVLLRLLAFGFIRVAPHCRVPCPCPTSVAAAHPRCSAPPAPPLGFCLSGRPLRPRVTPLTRPSPSVGSSPSFSLARAWRLVCLGLCFLSFCPPSSSPAPRAPAPPLRFWAAVALTSRPPLARSRLIAVSPSFPLPLPFGRFRLLLLSSVHL